MKFFLDSANLEEIKTANDLCLIDGIITSPINIAKENKNANILIKEISEIIDGPVMVQIISENVEGIIKEANALRRISENICIQLPIGMETLKACRELSDDGCFVNMTYCFSVTQAIIASKMGASFVSPFISGYDKKGFDGLKLAKDIKDTFNNYPELQTEIILNDIDKIFYISEALKLGVDACNLSLGLIKTLYSNALTDEAVLTLKEDFKKLDIENKGKNLY